MHAAVVRQFDHPPRHEEFSAPVPSGEHEEIVEVLASGLHPRVRSQVNGTHYAASEELPFIPGIDGVGRRSDGSLVYFLLLDTAFGSMAEHTVIDPRRSIPVPPDVDPVLLAAAMNPGMSSWMSLQLRVAFTPGQSVLILGATGSAGQLAIQIAKGRARSWRRDGERTGWPCCAGWALTTRSTWPPIRMSSPMT